jgi:hypothetical protein
MYGVLMASAYQAYPTMAPGDYVLQDGAGAGRVVLDHCGHRQSLDIVLDDYERDTGGEQKLSDVRTGTVQQNPSHIATHAFLDDLPEDRQLLARGVELGPAAAGLG